MSIAPETRAAQRRIGQADAAMRNSEIFGEAMKRTDRKVRCAVEKADVEAEKSPLQSNAYHVLTLDPHGMNEQFKRI